MQVVRLTAGRRLNMRLSTDLSTHVRELEKRLVLHPSFHWDDGLHTHTQGHTRCVMQVCAVIIVLSIFQFGHMAGNKPQVT